MKRKHSEIGEKHLTGRKCLFEKRHTRTEYIYFSNEGKNHIKSITTHTQHRPRGHREFGIFPFSRLCLQVSFLRGHPTRGKTCHS